MSSPALSGADPGAVVPSPLQPGCPHCTPAAASRIDWRFVGKEVEHGLVSMDRGLLYTLRMLMFRPGRLIREYLAGQRTGHVKPLWLLLTTAAVVVFASRYVAGADNAVTQLGAGYEAGVAAAGGNAEARALVAMFERINTWMGEHFAAATLLLIPLEAAVLKLALWRSNRLNYPEWLTITAFLTAQTFVLWVLFVLLDRWLPSTPGGLIWIAVAYSVVSLMFAFAPYPKWKTALRGALGFAAFGVANVVVIGAVAIVVSRFASPG